MIQSVCFIANKYPNKIDKNGLVFVQQLVWTMADLGIKCYVICPCAVNIKPKLFSLSEHEIETTENGSKIDVFFPKFIGFGQSHYIFGKSPAPITTWFFTKSVLRIINKYKLKIDAVYGHFAAPAGICAARVGRKLSIPSFMAHGESTDWSIKQFGAKKMKEEFETLAGVIAVSSRNRDLLIDSGVVSPEIINVFPNGYRPERFYRVDKQIARARLGWDSNKFIVGMVGSFIERKGPLRLQAAVEKLPNVYFACAGKGDQTPNSEKCIWAGPINNDELVYFYNALDIFVLPTLNEGCCNAIVEAIACGCPIITSDRSFNYDICDKSNAVLIDPTSVEEIALAIDKLRNNKYEVDSLREGSMKKAPSLTLSQRAKTIIDFMNVEEKKYVK